MVSTAISLVTMIHAVAEDDAAVLGWSFSDKRTRYKCIALYLWRVIDIGSKLLWYSLLWSGTGNSFPPLMLLGSNVSVGFLVCLYLKFKLSFLCSNRIVNIFGNVKISELFLTVALNLCFSLLLCRKSDHFTWGMSLLVIGLTPLYLGDCNSGLQQTYVAIFQYYGLVESIVVSISLWTFTDIFNYGEGWIFVVAVFAVIGGLSKSIIGFRLMRMSHDEIQWVRTDMKQLFDSIQWAELSEVIIFKMGSLSTACNVIFVEFISDPQFVCIDTAVCSVSERRSILLFIVGCRMSARSEFGAVARSLEKHSE